MSQTTHPAALQGEALTELLERARSLLEIDEASISKTECQNAVAELLQQHPLAPATLRELRDLHALWLAVARPEMAHAALEQHRANVVRTHAGTGSPAVALELELLALKSACFDRSAGLKRLAAIQQQLFALPSLNEQLGGMWWQQATLYEAWDLLEAQLDWQYGPNHPEKHQLPMVWVHIRKASLAHYERKDNQRAQQHISHAIAALAEAAHGLGLDFAVRWEQLAYHVQEMAPALMECFVQAARAHLHAIDDPPVPQPIRRHWEVKYARWQAKAHAAQQQWDNALQWAERGHFRLEDEPFKHDSFGALRLEWLLKANRMDEAAELAWRGIWYVRSGIAQAAWQLALQQHETDHQRPHWNWILAHAPCRAGLFKDDEYHEGWLKDEELPAHPPAVYLARARTIAPGHPMHDLIEGAMLADQAQWEAALPLLEHGVLALPAWADNHSVRLLWCARFQCLTEKQALRRRPFPESHDAVWCLDIGIDLIEDHGFINATCPTSSDTTREQRNALGIRYYEQGLARCEAFFASGQGALMDADYDIYSRLCNNLAVQYRKKNNDLKKVIALHRAGIACYAHCQHYINLMFCAHDLKDWAEMLRAAEGHWHTVRIPPFLGHKKYNPHNYAVYIIEALAHLGRTLDLSIWLDRLHTWWSDRGSEEDEDDENLRADYLETLMLYLEKYVQVCPQEAHILLQAHLPEIQNMPHCRSNTLYLAGGVLARCSNQHEDILALYHKALTIKPNATHIAQAIKKQHASAKRQRIAARGQQLGAAMQRWWKKR